MRRFTTLLLLLVPSYAAVPAQAHAQYNFGGGYPFGGGGGGYFGNVGGYGLGGYGLGGYGVGAYGLGGGMQGVNPYGAVPGVSNTYYNPAWSYGTPYYSSGVTRNSPTLFPGFGASEMPRSRTNFYPAIPQPNNQVIAAALQNDKSEQDKARIEVHVTPASAKIYLDGVLTRQTGLDRVFITPALNAGSSYVLQLEAVYQDETGRTRTARRNVTVRAGETARVDVGDVD